MTNISLKVGANDRNINIQCHAVNQEVADTKVESHTVSVLCKYRMTSLYESQKIWLSMPHIYYTKFSLKN